jgi:hypothetical protein
MMRWMTRAALGLFLLTLTLAGQAQQTQIRRYDLYAGFAGFETPWLNLAQRGFHTQAGMNLRPWLSVGFDYSEGSGHNSLTARVLKASLRQELGAQIGALIQAGLLPPTYQLVVPTDASSQTFAAGPQLAWRRYQAVTFFARPSLGAIRQRVTPHPKDPVATAIVAQLLPAGSKLDWQGFYGFGGGVEWNATPHFGIRTQADLVYWRLFNDLLAQGTWTARYAAGLTYHWGRNIASK